MAKINAALMQQSIGINEAWISDIIEAAPILEIKGGGNFAKFYVLLFS